MTTKGEKRSRNKSNIMKRFAQFASSKRRKKVFLLPSNIKRERERNLEISFDNVIIVMN
jgi:hypothetical protein